jgi:hypothetical protein
LMLSPLGLRSVASLERAKTRRRPLRRFSEGALVFEGSRAAGGAKAPGIGAQP